MKKAPKHAVKAKTAPRRSEAPPRPVKRTGRPRLEAIRWTITRASAEFGKERTYLDIQRRRLHILPASDGKYSTSQVCAMIYTDKAMADARRAEADAETAVRRNMRESGEMLPTALASAALDPLGIILRQKICASSMTEAEKDEMLADITSGIAAIDWEKLAQENRK